MTQIFSVLFACCTTATYSASALWAASPSRMSDFDSRQREVAKDLGKIMKISGQKSHRSQ